MNNNVHNMI